MKGLFGEIPEVVKTELVKIKTFLQFQTCVVYPSKNEIFRALSDPVMKVENIKVVIIGQDPYHNGSACGLCFSIKQKNGSPIGPINPSLRNIYKELKNSGFDIVENGDLSHWKDQGCLLLNLSLTVEKGKPDSHTDKYKELTKQIISFVSLNTKQVVFLLMGKNAQSVEENITPQNQHVIIATSHPSPFSAFNTSSPFMGSNAFVRINDALKAFGKTPIRW